MKLLKDMLVSQFEFKLPSEITEDDDLVLLMFKIIYGRGDKFAKESYKLSSHVIRDAISRESYEEKK